jgi:DNA sulfur modification protein DndE
MRRWQLKFSKIKLSSKSQNILGRLKARTGLTPNLLARFAFCLSIKEKSSPNPKEYDKDGSEMEPTVLFGDYEPIYLGLMRNRLEKDGKNVETELNEMTRCHINRGVIALSPRIQSLEDFYELVKEERNV